MKININKAVAAGTLGVTAFSMLSLSSVGASNLSAIQDGVGKTGDSGSVDVDTAIANIVNLLSVIVGVVAVIMIIVGGFRYITSGGDSSGVSAAKNTILYAIVGLVVVALAQVIVRYVLGKL